MDLDPLASGARNSTKPLHEYDFDLGSCPEGHAVECYKTLIHGYEAFRGLLNRVTKNYQAITDENRSFVLQNTQEMTRCRMIDEWMEAEIGQPGPTAIRQKGCSHDAPTIKWSRVISAIQAGLFCQANDPNDFYRGQLGDYEYIITKRQWNILEKRKWNVRRVPSQSDWLEERNERQKVKTEYVRVADLLVNDAEKLRCLSKVIDEKITVIERFETAKRQSDILEEYKDKVPSQFDWREERSERQSVNAEYVRLAESLDEHAEKLRCDCRAIDEKDTVIEEFEVQKNGLVQLPAARHSSRTRPSEEPCHEDPAYEPSLCSVNDRDSHTTTPRSSEGPIETCTAKDQNNMTQVGKSEEYLFVHDLRSRGVPWKDVAIRYKEKFNIQGTCKWGTLQSKYSKEHKKRIGGYLTFKICPSRLREISLGTTRSPLNPHPTAPTIGGAVSKPVVRRIPPLTEPYDDETYDRVNIHASDSCPETLADNAVYIPFLNGLPLVPKVPRSSPGCQSDTAWSSYELEIPS